MYSNDVNAAFCVSDSGTVIFDINVWYHLTFSDSILSASDCVIVSPSCTGRQFIVVNPYQTCHLPCASGFASDENHSFHFMKSIALVADHCDPVDVLVGVDPIGLIS